MRVLITGVAGSIGRYLLEEITRDPSVEPVLFDKNKWFLKKIHRKYNYEIYAGDIRNKKELEPATKNIDYIIHLSSIIPPLADDDPDYAYDVNVNGTKNLIACLKKNCSNPFILYTSSISVYGDRLKDYYISVNDKIKPSYMDHYGETKVIGEQLIADSGMDYSIYRLTGIMGLNTGSRGIKNSIMFNMPLSTKIELSTTRDTGYALYQSLFHRDELKGKVFNLGGGIKCRITYRELLCKLFSSYGIRLSDLPEMSFATCNFHCGFFKDSYKLENIFHFQRDSIDSYSRWAIKKASGFIRLLVKLFYTTIIKRISRRSKPLRAYISRNYEGLRRFFGYQTPPLVLPD